MNPHAIAVSCSVAALFVVGFLLCSCQTVPLDNGIPNFRQVTNSVYRGGQPNPDGWAYLKSIGVTNVVKLNEESEGSDADAVKLGMTVHRFPISFPEQLIGPVNPKSIAGAVSSISSNTYLHCLHGQDRTGLAAACWRVKNGMPKADAEKEMLDHGFHKTLGGLWKFWENPQY